MMRLYHELAADLFRRGAADEIAATYYDSDVRGRVPVSPEHWRGRPRPELGDVFMFDKGVRQGFDRGRWYEPGAELYILEPSDPRLDPDRNALLLWPGLILPDIEVTVDLTPVTYKPIFQHDPALGISGNFRAWLNLRSPEEMKLSNGKLINRYIAEEDGAGSPRTLYGVISEYRLRPRKP
jgi:hypothetical protein